MSLTPLTPLVTSDDSGNTDLIPTEALPSYTQPALNSPTPSSSETETVVPSNTGAFASIVSAVGFVENLFTGPNLENIIFIFLGILLIGGGIFAFRSTQTIISTGGRLAGRAAEVAAA